MPEGHSFKALVEYMARALVDRPDEVSVEEIVGDATVVELSVAKDDLGKVIGRQGRTAKAMRAILGAAALKQNRRSTLEILD